jgi:rubrerythrin
MNKPTKIYEARNLGEAELVKSLLQSESIVANVQEGALENVFGEMASNAETLPTVWVDDADFAKAQKIIDDFKNEGTPADQARTTWTCPRCGEVLEGQFSRCWKCNTPRTEIA